MKSIRRGLAIVALLPAGAWAQSNVTISGIIDLGVRLDRGGAGSVKSLSSGQMVGSRLNFSGVEDLGSGWKAGFVLEGGIAADTGDGTANPPGGTGFTFGRTSALSIGSDRTGYLSFGRQYTPLWAVSASASNDPFYGSWLGGNSLVYSNTVLVSNSIVYSYGYTVRTMLLAAPRQGLGAAVLYAPGESPLAAAKNAGQQFGFNLSYGAGPWFGAIAHHQVRGSGPAINPAAPVSEQPRLQQQTASTAYDFGVLRLHLGVNRARNGVNGPSAIDRRSWSAGISAPIAANQTLRAMVGRADNRAAADADWSMFQIGYQYDFSKRTILYAAYGAIDNDPNAQAVLPRSLGAYARGSRPNALIAGIRHNF